MSKLSNNSGCKNKDQDFKKALKDPDFLNAFIELDNEFPGAEIDDSLINYVNSLEIKQAVFFCVGLFLTFAYYVFIIFISMKIEFGNIAQIFFLIPFFLLLLKTFSFALPALLESVQ